MDFSENYNCKYSTEIHSVHFCASRQQVTLHTGMFYTQSFSKGFATVSDCLRHDAPAVLAHMFDVLDYFLAQFPLIITIHFKSDGPTTQYKNKTLFFLITRILPLRYTQIRRITYNYSETGHGKGPADGIGRSLKRLADDQVKYGKDIPSFDVFFSVIKENSKKVYVSSVTETDNQLTNKIICFKGTRKMFQFTWKVENSSIIYFNTLSCLVCPPGDKCKHYYIGIIDYIKTDQ